MVPDGPNWTEAPPDLPKAEGPIGSPQRFLQQELGNTPKVADEILAAAKSRGFTRQQIMAAKDLLGVRDYREGTPSVWMWATE
jgi:hypothetical protein